MRYKSHKYRYDLTELRPPMELWDEEFIGEILGWLYSNLSVGRFRYNHHLHEVRFQHKEDRMGFKLRFM